MKIENSELSEVENEYGKYQIFWGTNDDEVNSILVSS